MGRRYHHPLKGTSHDKSHAKDSRETISEAIEYQVSSMNLAYSSTSRCSIIIPTSDLENETLCMSEMSDQSSK